MREIRDAIVAVIEEQKPMTVRQVFYQLVSRGVIEKSQNEYKYTVCRLLTEMRLDGTVSWWDIVDNTRWQRKPITHSSVQRTLIDTAVTYRRAIWDDQDVYVEVWLEKDALAGVVLDVTAPWDVALMVTRGYSSLSYLHQAAETFIAVAKPIHLYYLGDHDPSGDDIPRSVEKRIRQFAPDVDLTVTRLGVTPEQIEDWDLPGRPTKKTDSRSRNFEGDSVEVDAIPVDKLRELVEGAITQHINKNTYDALMVIEREERAQLMELADNFAGWD